MKKRVLLQKFLIVLVSLLFLLSAYVILSGNKTELELFGDLHILAYRIPLGLINLVIALSLWSKSTRYIAVAIGTAYLGGAIASELSIGDSGFIPALTMLILWIIGRIDRRVNKVVQKETAPTFAE